MSAQQPNLEGHGKFPPGIPILHGMVTPEEEMQEKEKERQQKEKELEEAFKERQVRAVESANTLAGRNVNLSSVAIFVSLIACFASWYQGCMARKSADVARETLQQMRVDSQESSAEFQAQMHHFDANLGQETILAGQAVTQALQTTKLAADTHDLANYSKIQSIASGKIARLTQQQIDISLRPYIGLDRVDVAVDGTVPTIRYIAVAKNSGSIPADGLIVNATSVIEYDGLARSFPSPSVTKPIRLSPGGSQAFPRDLVAGGSGVDIIRLIIEGQAKWTVYISTAYQWKGGSEKQCYHFEYQSKISNLGFMGADCPDNLDMIYH